MVDYWPNLAQFIKARAASAQKSGVIHKVNEPGELVKAIPRDSVTNWDIPVVGIFYPIVLQTG